MSIGSELAPDVGRGYFPLDKLRHQADAPRFCPACAAPLSAKVGSGRGITVEYWSGRDRVFVCFCGACRWTGDVVLSERVEGHEPDH